MRRLWQSATCVALVGVATSALTLFGHITYGDVVRYHSWVDPAVVRAPLLGQFYLIDPNGTIKEPLCALEQDDVQAFAPPPYVTGRRYINRLGEATPAILDVFGLVTGPLHAAGGTASGRAPYALELEIEYRHAPASALRGLTRWILTPRDLDQIDKVAGRDVYQEAVRLRDCAAEITASLASGYNVCQVNEVVQDGESGELLGLSFASRCLARETDTEPRIVSVRSTGSFLSTMKESLQLLDVEPLS